MSDIRKHSPAALLALCVCAGLCTGTCTAETASVAAAPAMERLLLSAREIEQLGIRIAAPVQADTVPMPVSSATVVAPPASQHVVSAALPGLLTRILVAPGDRVAQGQQIASIDSPELVALQVDLLDAQSRLRQATADLEREQALFDEGIIPERRYLATRSEHEQADAAEALARQHLRLAGLSPGDMDRLGRTRELASQRAVVSPIAGTVLEQYEMPGARLHQADPILRIADLSTLWLILRVDPAQLADVHPGQLVAPAGQPTRPIARIDRLGAEVDPQTQTVQVRAVILPQATDRRYVGEFVSAQILQTGGPLRELWQVPTSALVRSEDRQAVFVRDDGGFIVLPVSLVREDGTNALIRGPLGDQARVVVAGTATLKALWLQ